jgi:hypothetical protein
MIGDTIDEENAFYLGLIIGCYVGLKLAFLIWLLKNRKKSKTYKLLR